MSKLAFADAYDVSCSYCVSGNDFKNFAKNFSKENFENSSKVRSFDHTLYVFNHDKGKAKKVLVTGEGYNITGEPGITFVTLGDIPLQKRTAFATAYNELYSSILVKKHLIPPSIAYSGYDLVGADYLHQQVIDEYKDNLPVHEKLANYIAAAAGIAGKVVDVNFVIEVSFSDGSTIFFKITGIDANGQLTYNFHNGVDADGNIISELPSHYSSGSLSFKTQGESGVQNFLNAAVRSGVPIADKRLGSGSVVYIVCSQGVCNLTTPSSDPE